MSQSTTLYAFFIRVEERLIKTVVDTASDEKWVNNIRQAANLPDADVVLIREDEWDAPVLSSLQDEQLGAK